jgi:hypothetical protein
MTWDEEEFNKTFVCADTKTKNITLLDVPDVSVLFFIHGQNMTRIILGPIRRKKRPNELAASQHSNINR